MCLLDLLQGKGEKWDAVGMSCTLFGITVTACKCGKTWCDHQEKRCSVYIYIERESIYIDRQTDGERQRQRCSVQIVSFKVCFGLWIKNREGETLRYRDSMPF